ncbi:MAG: ATP-binding protein, partial [Bacteroidota bacterium]|nr:ATP-binding protein [Bacteroidota bacterium]
MNIKKINIENYRSISNVNFEFDSLLNVFVGVNGSGKTTILDALKISLSRLVNRIQRENVSGSFKPTRLPLNLPRLILRG